MSARSVFCYAFAIALGGWAIACSSDFVIGKVAIPTAELEKLITNDTSLINSTIDAGLTGKRNQHKAKVTAIMVAAYAQSGMIGEPAKAPKFAATRDLAVRLAESIAAGKTDDVKKIAKDLAGTVRGSENGKVEPMDLTTLLHDLEPLMHQFKPEAAGGREWEAKLTKLTAKKAALSASEYKDCVQLGFAAAVIAQFTEAMAPEGDQGKKKKSEWMKWSREMAESGVAAGKAASASKPDDKAVKAALNKLDETCKKCHSMFRD